MKRNDDAEGMRAFSALRQGMNAGDSIALARLRRHVQRRVKSGWSATTIAKRLGLALPDVARLARIDSSFDDTPRVKRKA